MTADEQICNIKSTRTRQLLHDKGPYSQSLHKTPEGGPFQVICISQKLSLFCQKPSEEDFPPAAHPSINPMSSDACLVCFMLHSVQLTSEAHCAEG